VEGEKNDLFYVKQYEIKLFSDRGRFHDEQIRRSGLFLAEFRFILSNKFLNELRFILSNKFIEEKLGSPHLFNVKQYHFSCRLYY
jgi:hypothetical protein